MSKTDKLKAKLANGSINARELRTLLAKEGATLIRTKGSHEQWARNGKLMTLATHDDNLKPYQIKEAKEFLNG